MTVSEIALSFPQSIEILDKYNLDYYCNGSKSFLTACAERSLDARRVWEEVTKCGAKSDRLARALGDWEPFFLIEVILRHYGELTARISEIRMILETLLAENQHPSIQRLYSSFNQLGDALIVHMTFEEGILMQALKARNSDKVGAGRDAPLQHLSKPRLEELGLEHQYVGSLIHAMRVLTKNYTMKNLSVPSIQLAGIMLQQFDRELTQRLHLENNILFPKLRMSSAQ